MSYQPNEANRARMREMVEYMKEYINTYTEQYGYENYQDHTFIDDMLYAVGRALNREHYQYADGFRRFQMNLIRHIAARLTNEELAQLGLDKRNIS